MGFDIELYYSKKLIYFNHVYEVWHLIRALRVFLSISKEVRYCAFAHSFLTPLIHTFSLIVYQIVFLKIQILLKIIWWKIIDLNKNLLPNQTYSSKYWNIRGPKRPAIITITRQDDQQKYITNLIGIQNSLSAFLKKKLIVKIAFNKTYTKII